MLELRNRANAAMYFMLRWKGIMAGPFEGEGTGLKHYHQEIKDILAAEWFHIEIYLQQSTGYTGRLTVWQDGVEIYDMVNVKTKYPDGNNEWSINTYGASINPMPLTLYVDDAAVSTTRVGPVLNTDQIPPNPPSGLRIISDGSQLYNAPSLIFFLIRFLFS